MYQEGGCFFGLKTRWNSRGEIQVYLTSSQVAQRTPQPFKVLTMLFRLLSSVEGHWSGRWNASKKLARHYTVFLITGRSGVVQSVYWPDRRLYRGIVFWFQIGIRNCYLSQCLLAGSWARLLLTVGTWGCSLRSEAATTAELTSDLRLVPR